MPRSRLALPVLLFLCACAATAPAPEKDAPLPANVPVAEMDPFTGFTAEMEGIWASNGYGIILDIANGDMIAYSVTDEVCLPFREDESSFVDYTDVYKLTADGQTLHVGATAEQHTYQFFRQDGLPARCLAEIEDTPAANFDAFVSFMGTHYAFFELYGVDWEARTQTARARLRDEMSNAELFELMTGTLDGIDDAHLTLSVEIDGEIKTYDPVEGRTYLEVIRQGAEQGLTRRQAKRAFQKAVWREGIGENLLAGEGVLTGNNFLQYGIADGDIGYFAMFTVGGYTENGFDDPLADYLFIEEILNDAITAFEEAGVRAVIVDATMNHGGYDFISRAIASHFAPARAKIYTKRPGDAALPYQTQLWLEPSESKVFTGPVYLLTSDITVSGGETMSLSFRPLLNVTHAGTKTRGALSDILEKRLPNGRVLGLSNEIYTDADGILWEGRGITPEMELEIFPTEDLAGGHEKAVRSLIEFIRAQ